MTKDALKPMRAIHCETVKVDAGRRLVFGFGIVCKVDGEEYFDLQDEHIPEDVMLDASLDFAKSARVAKEQHDGEPVGMYPFIFPLTAEIAKALELETRKTGMLVAAQFDAETFARFESGELTGFSIAGAGMVIEEDEA